MIFSNKDWKCRKITKCKIQIALKKNSEMKNKSFTRRRENHLIDLKIYFYTTCNSITKMLIHWSVSLIFPNKQIVRKNQYGRTNLKLNGFQELISFPFINFVSRHR